MRRREVEQMSIISRDTPKTRHAVDLTKQMDVCNAQSVSDMVRSLTGEADLDLVRDAMIRRYAQVIVPTKDEITGATDSALYRVNSRLTVDAAAQSAILAGQQEIIRLYLFPSIVRQRATLFSEPGNRYEYEDGDEVEDIIEEVRDDAEAQLAAQRWDTFSDGIGSCALYISDAGGVLQYSEIPPHQIHIAYAESITDGDQERPANEMSIDEASVVAIELCPVGDKRKFVAYFGPSDEYELGRCVVYTGGKWTDIPEVGSADALEYSQEARAFVREARDPANPLSLIAKTQGQTSGPVYPVVILRGQSMSSGLLPVSSSLYQVCGEFDLMGSMILGAAGRGARGAKALKRGTDTQIPDAADEGLVLLGREQELLNVGWPASHSADASRVLNEFARHIAEAHEVPGWLVVADDVANVPSGVALEIMTQPLTRNRNARIALNRSAVARRFGIERLIINGAVGQPVIGYDVRERWIPGERTWPRDPEAEIRTWQARIAAGESDLADMVQDMRSMPSREAAINFLEERKNDERMNPPKPETPEIARPATLAERIEARKAARTQPASEE
jgi:hypothetical protein